MCCNHCKNDSDLIYEIRLLSQELKEIRTELKGIAGSKWIQIEEVSKYTSLSVSTIRRAVQSGKLKCSKITGKLLFKMNWVDKFLGGGR